MFAFAFEHGKHLADEFVTYFKAQDEACYDNYCRLAKEEGVYEQFQANPLAFIVSNSPMCCMKIAEAFCKEQATCPFKAGQILWQRSICDSTHYYRYQVIKVCKKTAMVQEMHRGDTNRCRIITKYNPSKRFSQGSPWELHNESRRIFLSYADRS